MSRATSLVHAGISSYRVSFPGPDPTRAGLGVRWAEPPEAKPGANFCQAVLVEKRSLLILGQPPQSVIQLIPGVVIEKAKQAIPHFPPSKLAADLILRDENNARVFSSLRLPFLVNKTEITLRIAVVTSYYYTPLLGGHFQYGAVVPLHFEWERTRFRPIVALGPQGFRQLRGYHHIEKQTRKQRAVRRRGGALAHATVVSRLGACVS